MHIVSLKKFYKKSGRPVDSDYGFIAREHIIKVFHTENLRRKENGQEQFTISQLHTFGNQMVDKSNNLLGKLVFKITPDGAIKKMVRTAFVGKRPKIELLTVASSYFDTVAKIIYSSDTFFTNEKIEAELSQLKIIILDRVEFIPIYQEIFKGFLELVVEHYAAEKLVFGKKITDSALNKARDYTDSLRAFLDETAQKNSAESAFSAYTPVSQRMESLDDIDPEITEKAKANLKEFVLDNLSDSPGLKAILLKGFNEDEPKDELILVAAQCLKMITCMAKDESYDIITRHIDQYRLNDFVLRQNLRPPIIPILLLEYPPYAERTIGTDLVMKINQTDRQAALQLIKSGCLFFKTTTVMEKIIKEYQASHRR